MSRSTRYAGSLVGIVSFALVVSIAHAAVDAPRGQWSGNSRIDGDRAAVKTTLSLGAPDGDDSLLRIDGRNVCTLKHGTYRSNSAGTWDLSFKEMTGGDACARLAKGTFTLRAGSTPRQLDFEVKYPGADGQDLVRRGALNRYP